MSDAPTVIIRKGKRPIVYEVVRKTEDYRAGLVVVEVERTPSQKARDAMVEYNHRRGQR